jgi:DNA invertase Pin-like site-specific DNA recombinase
MKLYTYNRVSTDDQKTGLLVYKERMDAFCARWNHTIVDSWEDEDVSGGIPLKDRPAGSIMYKNLFLGKADGVLFDNVSRMFRDMEDGITTVNRFTESGIKMFVSDGSADPIDIESESGFLFFVMQLTFAHIERMKIKKRTKDAHTMRRKTGLPTSHTQYGFDKVNGRLVIREDEMDVVTLILKSRDEDKMTFDLITNNLNDQGIPSKKGGKWSKKVVFGVYNYHKKIAA